MPFDPTELVEVRLAPAELSLVEAALHELGGTASGTTMRSILTGAPDGRDSYRRRDQLLSLIRAGAPMTRMEWTRVLLFTELAFASDMIGSGVEWPIVTGLDDLESIVALRLLQRQLVGVVASEAGVADLLRADPEEPS